MEMTYEEALNISKFLMPSFKERDSKNSEVLRTRLQEALLIKAGFQPEGFLNTQVSEQMKISYTGKPIMHSLYSTDMCFKDNTYFICQFINVNDYDDVPEQFGGFPSLYPFYLASMSIDNQDSYSSLEAGVADFISMSSYGYSEDVKNQILSLALVISDIHNASNISKNAVLTTVGYTVSEYIDKIATAYASLIGISKKAVWDNIDLFSKAITYIGECEVSDNESDFIALFAYRNIELGEYLNYKKHFENLCLCTEDVFFMAIDYLANVLKNPFSYASGDVVTGMVDNTYYQFTLGCMAASDMINPSIHYAKVAWDLLYPVFRREVMYNG